MTLDVPDIVVVEEKALYMFHQGVIHSIKIARKTKLLRRIYITPVCTALFTLTGPPAAGL